MDLDKKNSPRDPIKKSPMRNPGSSLEAAREQLLVERGLPWIVMGLLAVLLAGLEWLRWGFVIGPHPGLFSLAAMGVVLLAAFHFHRAVELSRRLKQGLKGERHVGHYLQNSLLRKNYWVVHDIPIVYGNIDHALIGPGGIFAVETKTYSKPPGDARIDYDGESVSLAGGKPTTEPIDQARAAAAALQRILQEYTGEKPQVRPVVLFPGWYVNPQPQRAEVWVLNENAFVEFVGRSKPCLEKDEIFKFAAALGRFVRDAEEKERVSK